MLILDVDGVLTDGGIFLIGQDTEAKRFDVQDGMGINLARAAGLTVAIISSRSSDVVQRRAKELKIDEVIQGMPNKLEGLETLLGKYSVAAPQAAYIGDDLQDIPVMKRVGLPIAVQNAVQTVKDISLYVTGASGGHGAVREAVEWLLELRSEKDAVYKTITG
ncbi:3-deoxy-D-manno-octulosonate 8-phosphate phosphatase [SAR202 cluster bacterium AD-802-F09_MRT_200m]|nr:3-deoxy-D-manno-octulosonate 8-phosphate phosphatase [SAR202 cluster bacterium AD-802-F09_MRT_200m]